MTNPDKINESEAEGITRAGPYTFELDSEEPLSTWLILTIHKLAFGHLYDWAGKWRTIQVVVGQLEPPSPNQVLPLMYQFIDNLNFKVSFATTGENHLDCLVFAHYEFIRIHPFTNGNRRTGRILMNIVAMKLGYQLLTLYHRQGQSRSLYIGAMKAADRGDFEPLKALLSEELVAF